MDNRCGSSTDDACKHRSNSNQLTYAVHSDHLGRPEAITNSSNAIAWKTASGAFTRRVTQDSIGGYHIGFPRQYYDAELATWSNGFRDYDARSGRFLQVDPMGIGGGLNGSKFAGGNPVMISDELGLDVCIESTENPTVPFGLNRRVAVYNSKNELVYSQSYGTNDPNASLFTFEAGKIGKYFTGSVYQNTSDPSWSRIQCTSTSDRQNNEIVVPALKGEIGYRAPYSTTGINGENCRSCSKRAYFHVLEKLPNQELRP